MDAVYTAKEIRALRKRSHDDRKRIMRVVEYLFFGSPFEGSPVEVADGYIVSDTEDHTVYASFVFKNISDKSISSLGIKLKCYQNANIPYLKLPFEYSYRRYTLGELRRDGERIRDRRALASGNVAPGETFGEAVYIPLPESYFKRLEVELTDIVFSDGEHTEVKKNIGRTVDKFTYAKQKGESRHDRIREYYAASEKYPIVTKPREDDFTWVCCCGYKNPEGTDECIHCNRNKSWQMRHLADMELEQAKNGDELPPVLQIYEGEKYKQNKYMENKADIVRKMQQYDKAMQNIAIEEYNSEKRKLLFLPKLILAMLAVWLVWLILHLLLLK